MFRTPNGVGTAEKPHQSEIDLLLEEFAFSNGWKLFLNEIADPIVREIRTTLLTSPDISGEERGKLMARLKMLERLFEDLYARTAAQVTPEVLKNFFR